MVFAGLIFLDMALLAWMATRYQYVDSYNTDIKSKEKDDDTIAGNNPKTLSAPFSGPPRLHFFSSHLVVVVVVVVVVDVVGYILLGLVSLG